MNKPGIYSAFKDSAWVVVGTLSAAFGLKGFLLPNNFIDGGATGISLLIAETTKIDLSLTIVLINIPFILVGFWHMSRKFVIKTIFGVCLMAIFLLVISFPVLTSDKLLVAIFGGFFLGAGIGLSIRGGCVIDGTEVLALHLSRKFGQSLGDMIMIINIIIFLVAALLLSVESALYSMITYFFAMKTMDYIIQGIEEYLGVWVISKNSAIIKENMVNEMGMGVTVFKGSGGYGKNGLIMDENDILCTVVSRLELLKINRLLEKTDPSAFIIVQGIRDVRGGVLNRKINIG
ncbi:MAG: YitT family protein [Fulvivirga sp.]|uniref:YitT family protein n=1 Tax=Fulvivirga sp. TaxID=1931237 RepID=UPI0032EC7F48